MEVLVRKPNDKQRKVMESCKIWEHEKGSFPWEYKEKQETCLIISGKAYVEDESGEKTYFGPGDLVTFPRHWNCTWNVTEDIKKYYIFDAEF